MPTGISSGLKSVLAAVSASVTTAPPAIAAQGSRYSWSLPINRRMMCGTMRPTKPSMPATLTETAASSAERKINIVRMRITRTPKLFANSSPNCNAFRERAHKIVPIMPIALYGKSISTCPQLRP